MKSQRILTSQLLKTFISLETLMKVFLSAFRPLFTEVQLINPSRAALVPVLPLSPENSQNNISNAPHPADIHPAYRIPYMQLLHTLHSATSPQSSLHGKFWLDWNVSDFNSVFIQQEQTSRQKIFLIRVPWVFHTPWTVFRAATLTWNV